MARIINTADLLETSALDHNARMIANIKQELRLDPTTGKLYWKIRKRGRHPTKPAGGVTDTRGYIRITLANRVRWYAHQLVWMLTNNQVIPPGYEIDHINRLKCDNRPENLRLVTKGQNMKNRAGIVGYSKVPSGRYAVRTSGKYIGTYDTEELAKAAYMEAVNGENS